MVHFIKPLALSLAVTFAAAHASEMTGTTTVAKAYAKTKGSNEATRDILLSATATMGTPAATTVLLAPMTSTPPVLSTILTAPAPVFPSIADGTSAQPTTVAAVASILPVDTIPPVAMASVTPVASADQENLVATDAPQAPVMDAPVASTMVTTTSIAPNAQLQSPLELASASPVAMMALPASAMTSTPTGQAINAIARIDPSQGGRAKARSVVKTTAGDAKIKVKAIARRTPHGTVTKTKVKVRGELPPGTTVNAIASVGNTTVAKSSVGGNQ